MSLSQAEWGELAQLDGAALKLDGSTNYTLMTSEMLRWFRPEVLKNLDEQGVPVQIAERFYMRDDGLRTLANRLVRIARTVDRELTEFERRWILDALPGY